MSPVQKEQKETVPVVSKAPGEGGVVGDSRETYTDRQQRHKHTPKGRRIETSSWVISDITKTTVQSCGEILWPLISQIIKANMDVSLREAGW